MLTPAEEKFIAYWEAQRQNKKQFLRRFSIGLPLVVVTAVGFFINFFSGWYRRADTQLRSNASLIIVIFIAVVAVVVFFTLFSTRYKWEQNEADYQALVAKKIRIPKSTDQS